ncbi:ABC transporter substrate-binding protein [Streptacidiphilus rugosus]|uniref:ABC transporter substrate-binding protein n=1 Tax=Streptacidiphilus rugosus TaxID=405783 RepID=UPI00056046A4|nr:ABC transporter substrate-binding protein [Streptacidiphilus rugosus]
MSRRVYIPALLAAVLVAGGCSSGSPSTPGVTATTVTIGSHQPLSGPSAAGSSEEAPAAKAYFEFVNDHGGVNGRKIIYDYQDDAGNPANTVTVVHRLVEKEKVFAVFDGFGTPTHQAVAGYLNAQGVPDLFPASACTCWNDPAKLPYTFGWVTDYHREGKILGTYVAKAFPGKRIAYFYQDNDFGRQAVQGLDTVVPAASVVARETYQPTYRDVTPQMRAIVRARADVIISLSAPSYTALLRLAQQKLGNTAQLVVNVGGSDPVSLSSLLRFSGSGTAAGQGSPLIQGVITDAYLTPTSDISSGWTSLAKMIHDRYIPAAPFDHYTVYGMATAYTFVQALQRAGKNPTRQSLIAAIERGGLSPGPGLTPLDYSHTSHGGYTGAQIGVVKGDTVVLQGQPLTTDDGKGPVVPYTTPQAPAPASGIPAP